MTYIDGLTEADIQATAEQRTEDCGCGDLATHLAEVKSDYSQQGEG